MFYRPYWLCLSRVKPSGLYKTGAETSRVETSQSQGIKDKIEDGQRTESFPHGKGPKDDPSNDLKDMTRILPKEKLSPSEQGVGEKARSQVKNEEKAGELGKVVLDLSGFKMVTPGVYRFNRHEASSQQPAPPRRANDTARQTGQQGQVRLEYNIPDVAGYIEVKSGVSPDSIRKIPVYSFG